MSEDDYGISSDDENDILELAERVDRGAKRSPEEAENLPHAKRRATSAATRSYSSALKALRSHFGFPDFRLKQQEVVSRLLSGQSAAVVFPTGGGKSLCYQVPALVFEEEDKANGLRGPGKHGITLVVSPLLALMKDQVDALVRRGIRAATLDSSKTREEYLHTCKLMRNGELKILYCAPERLNNEGFVEQMKYVQGGIRLLAVDEAHCISEWGHAFRPDYLKIARFAREIKAERVVCLTATATPRVAKDICKAFEIDVTDGLFRTSTYRANLHLLARSAQTKAEIYPHLLNFLQANVGATIIYVTLQKQTEELAAMLIKDGFNARTFHAGMETAEKVKLQEQFMKANDLIIVATIAFGMGIDKSSIRNVIHMNVPSSIESYSQEIGRAGRDGMKSNCVFYLNGEDLYLREMFARGDLPSVSSVRNLLMEIFTSNSDGKAHNKLPVGSDICFSHLTQEKEYDIRSTTLKNVYAQLELTYGLIRATTPIYSKYSFIEGARYPQTLASDTSKSAEAIKQFAKKAKKLSHIDVVSASDYFKISRADVVRKLNDWSESGIIELRPAGVLNVYTITAPLPTSPAQIEEVATGLYRTLESREAEALQRTDEMLSLITSKSCFSASLATHFGDSLPDRRKECGHCQWCLTHEQVQQPTSPKTQFNMAAFNAILAAVPERDDPRLLARIAFGISSPRVTALKMGKHALFGSMNDHNFAALLKKFTTACNEAG